MSKKKTAAVWNHFIPKNQRDRLAVCNYCAKTLSYKSTITNLKLHLKQKHIEVYDVLCSSETQRIHDGDDNEAKASQELMKHSSEIRSYFEQEVGGWHRCVICRATRTRNLTDLMEHLKEKHPKLLAEIEQIESGSESDNEDSPSDNAYTEVVYLEDDVKIENKKPDPYVHRSTPKRQKIEKTPRQQSFYEVAPVQRQTPEDEELESFVKYISCLLKQVPKDTFGKLQMDIVNLIMNAKLNSTVTHSNVVYENIIQNVGSSNMPILIKALKEQGVGKSSVPVPEFKVISQKQIPVTNTVTGTYATATLNGENSIANNDE